MVALAALGAPGCGDGLVTLAFRPEPGATYQYEARVASTVQTMLPGRPPSVETDEMVLGSRQRVIDARNGDVRVEVVLDRPGIGERTYVMRFDRAAQLTSVDTVEGIPAAALGELGLSEIFPAAAAAPPPRPLQPGDRWTVDERVKLPGMSEPARLTGEGRLIELAVVDGRDTATVRTTTALPVTSSTLDASGAQTLAGTERTEVRATYDLADGSVLSSTAVTSAAYDLTLGPPRGVGGLPLQGILMIEVRSSLRRL